MPITKHWRISRILEEVPESIEPMMEIGLHCFGCSANTEERLNEGMQVHGFSDEQIEQLVDSINKIQEKNKEAKMKKPQESDFLLERKITGNKSYYQIAGLLITESAFDIIHELGQGKSGLHIQVEAGGCSGYSYKYNYLDKAPKDTETYTLSGDIDIYMDNFTFDKLHGSIVDYKKGLQLSGLVFKNPNAKDSCHCGVSVNF